MHDSFICLAVASYTLLYGDPLPLCAPPPPPLFPTPPPSTSFWPLSVLPLPLPVLPSGPSLCSSLPLPPLRYDDALDLYESILRKESTCAEIWRRKVAVFKAQRDIDRAIKEMNEYLKV